jgi:hypothetical protein
MGTRTFASGTRRRYRCTSVSGAVHTFSVPLDGEAQPVLRGWSPPPPCPAHPISHVIRFGRYASSTPKPRQRYRCTPSDGSKPHVFTPLLPRDHVHPYEGGCTECEELRGTHRGETAVARRHSWPTRIVARALFELSAGASYADVSRWAIRAADAAAHQYTALPMPGGRAGDAGTGQVPMTEVARVEPPHRLRRVRQSGKSAAASHAEHRATAEGDSSGRRRKNARSAESHNVWHVAADWCEVFGPVVFEPVETRLRQQALAERTRLDVLLGSGQPLDRPQVLLLDDVPIYGRDRSRGGKSRRDEGFFLLVAGEMHWGEADPFDTGQLPTGVLKLRVVRAMAKSNAHAWRLLFDELGYAPDFVVADAGTGIARAIDTHFDQRTTFVPSLWHVGQAVRTGLAKTPGASVAGDAGKQLRPELEAHLGNLSRAEALVDGNAWKHWWDTLEAACASLKLPRDRVRARRANYEQPFAQAIPKLATHPFVPVSTGGLETLMSKRVQPLLALRRTNFGNLERTNRLFDLAVAREHGAFDDLTEVVGLLRQDALHADGWTVPLRAVADPRPARGRYSSLRDATLLAELAQQRGLA